MTIPRRMPARSMRPIAPSSALRKSGPPRGARASFEICECVSIMAGGGAAAGGGRAGGGGGAGAPGGARVVRDRRGRVDNGGRLRGRGPGEQEKRQRGEARDLLYQARHAVIEDLMRSPESRPPPALRRALRLRTRGSNGKHAPSFRSSEGHMTQRNLIAFFIAIAFACAARAAGAADQPQNSPEGKKIVALVNEAVKLVEQKGKDAFPALRKDKKWNNGDVCIFIHRFGGLGLLQPPGSDIEGKKLLDWSHAKGKKIVREFVQLAKSK